MEITNFYYSDGRGSLVSELIIASAIAPCPICGSTRINLVKMPDYSSHHAARRCAECDSFRGWESKPATKEKQRRQQTTISHLLKSSQLSQWEREFLQGLKTKKLSSKQQEVLSRIEAKVEGGI